MIQFSCLTGHVCETNCNLLNKIANATATHAKNEMRLQWNYGKLFRQFRTFSRLHSNQRQSQDHHHHHGRSRLRLGAICDTDCSDSWHAAWTALACDMCSCLKKRAENTWRWVGGTPRKMTMKEWGEKEEVPPEVKANYKGAANPFSKVFSLYPVPKVILHSP